MSKPHRPQPQLLLTLSPAGNLAVELPGHSGSRRQIELRLDTAGSSLLRMLQAQASGLSPENIGLDSAPTRAQVEHWERHASQPSETCQFCIAEGAVQPGTAKHQARRQIITRSAGVEVRVLQPAGAHATPKPLRRSAEEYGL